MLEPLLEISLDFTTSMGDKMAQVTEFYAKWKVKN